MKISPRLLLPPCLPARPTKGPTTRAPLPRQRAATTWPVLQLLRPLQPSPAPLVRRVTACLQPASCANFILHTTAPRSHYIAWLGLLQKKTNDGRSCTRGATGAARAPKLDKTPNTAARRRCRRRNLFFKIKVRPRSCRPYPVWRPCSVLLKM